MFQSSGFQLQDTNDFISPSQACIKPVETLNNISKNDGKAQVFIYIHPIDYYLKISITIDDSGNYFEENEKLETAQITLNDCLACSGCITSAESILVASQSHLELEKALLRKKESLEVCLNK